MAVRGGAAPRVALVGAGFIAGYHAEVLRRLRCGSVVAICDPEAARARQLADRCPGAIAVGSAEALPALGVDVAHVLTPPDSHESVAAPLLTAGIDVLVEKPLALSSTGASALATLASARGARLAVNHNLTWHPAFVRLQRIIAEGRIGSLVHLRVTFVAALSQLEANQYSHWMFQAPQNIVYEQAIHPFSQVHALVGAIRDANTTVLKVRELKPGQLFCERFAVAARAARGSADFLFDFGGGAPAIAIHAYGSDGAVVADLIHDSVTAENPAAAIEVLDHFITLTRRGRAALSAAAANLTGYLASGFGLTPPRDPFMVGLMDSIASFYADRRQANAARRQVDDAREVIGWCEAVATALPPPATPALVPKPAPPRPGEIVVLGGTGFIGRPLIRQLMKRDHPITVLSHRPAALAPDLLGAAQRGDVRICRGALEDRDALARVVRGARTVVHLATGAGATWREVQDAMVNGSIALAEAAVDAGVSRFIYVSSIAALDARRPHAGGCIEDALDTDRRPDRRDVYSRGKIAVERALLDLHRSRGLPLIIVRPGIVLGKDASYRHTGLGEWMNTTHCLGWGQGNHPLPLVLVDDVADGIIRVVEFEGHDLDGRALNLCSRVNLTARDVVDALAKELGRPLEFHPRPLPALFASELAKWSVKKVMRRQDLVLPAYAELASRSLLVPFASDTARRRLGWQPVEDRESFLAAALPAAHHAAETPAC